MFYQIECPFVTRRRDFLSIFAALVEKSGCAGAEPWKCEFQKTGERRERTCGNDICPRHKVRHDVYSLVVHKAFCGRCRKHSSKKSRFFPNTFNEMKMNVITVTHQDGEHNAGKTASRSKVKPCAAKVAQARELRTVQNVASPEIFERGGSGKIDFCTPMPEYLFELDESFKRFT